MRKRLLSNDMTASEIKKLKNELEEQLIEQERLLQDFDEQETEASRKDLGDRVDQATDSSIEVLERVKGSEIKLIAKIKLALARIEDGSYGACSNCQEEIPLARLQAKPSVSLCLSCQTKHEQGQ
ncbi:MAG: TraR/DksA family transcriptional regulator [Roseibacillus sp.]